MKKQFFLLGLVLHGCLFATQAQQDSAKLYQKTEQLLVAMKMPDMFTNVVNETVEQQLTTTPALAAYKAHPLYAQTTAKVKPLRELRYSADVVAVS